MLRVVLALLHADIATSSSLSALAMPSPLAVNSTGTSFFFTSGSGSCSCVGSAFCAIAQESVCSSDLVAG